MDILLQLPTQTSRFAQIKTLRTEVLSVCTLIFRFPAGFGTLCVIHTGCRASQGLSPQPLLISRYSVVRVVFYHPCVRLSRDSRTYFSIFLELMQNPLPQREKRKKGRSRSRALCRFHRKWILSNPWPARRSGSSRRGKCPDGPRPEPGISPCRPRWRCRRQP